MDDTENNVSPEVSSQDDSAQREQGSAPESDADVTPAETPSDKGEKILGKFNTPEDLAKAYQELESKFTSERQRTREDSGHVPATGYVPEPAGTVTSDLPFDNETITGLETWYEQRREREKASEFMRKHKEELADPLLAGATAHIIREANARNERIDQEDALSQAKQELERRLQPKAAEARSEGFEEGKDLARQKQLAGAVGESRKVETKSDDELSSAEFAAKYNIPRA